MHINASDKSAGKGQSASGPVTQTHGSFAGRRSIQRHFKYGLKKWTVERRDEGRASSYTLKIKAAETEKFFKI